MRARIIAVAALAAVPAALVAQDVQGRVVGGVEYYSVQFGTGLGVKSVSELVAPIGVVMPIGRRFSLDAGTYLVDATRKDASGASASISGLTDILVRGGVQLVPDVAVLTVALNLPTGTSTLNSDQLLVAGNTATDLLPFPVTSFGSGFNATTGLAVAVPVGGWALGAAGSFRVNGEYTPIAADSANPSPASFKPGNEYRLRVGMDRVVGQGRVTFGVTFSTFSHDEIGGDRLTPGKRLITQAAWNVPVGHRMLSLYGWDVLRRADSSTTTIGVVPPSRENTVALGATLGIRTGRHMLRPMIEYRRAWRGTTSFDSYGSLFSIGARHVIAASPRWTVTPGLRLDLGSITGVGVTGFSASVTVRAGL